MECKFICPGRCPVTYRELIDTLWNVNESAITFISWAICELIDTLWNVNHDACGGRRISVGRINRYIMECK